MRWWTADEHYGHVRITELCRRPFASGAAGVPSMNAELVWRHNKLVAEEDEVTHLGDFALGKIDESLPIVSQLNGEHVLVAGNHDRFSPAYGHEKVKREIWREHYLAAGFEEAWPDDEGPLVTAIGAQMVLLSHYPYAGDPGYDQRFAELRLRDTGAWLLHGHVHATWRQRGRMINVGVDAWGGFPVSEEQIAELIEAGPRDLEPVPW